MSNAMKWIIFIAIILLAYKMLSDIGILDTKEDRKADQLGTLKPFDPAYWKQFKDNNKNVITKTKAIEYAKLIFDAKGYVSDTDDQAIGVFKKLNSRALVSYVSYIFFELYKRDLGSYLNFMDEKNMATLNNYISKLPAK